MVYQWKRNMPVSAQATGEHFEKLEKKHGEITPEIILDDARKKSSVLHDCFEWDDGRAAEKYRLSQARFIICNLVVSVESKENEQKKARAFVNVSAQTMKGNKGSFVSIGNAISNEEMRQNVLRNALVELLAFKKKYEELEGLQRIFVAIDDLEQEFSA